MAMTALSPFRAGAKAAIPIWIAFVPFSFSLGLSAKAYGLHWGEIVLMSALVFAGPAQFAALEPLASGRPALQILLTTFLINLRFIPMSAALAPYFRRVKRVSLLFAAQFISASSFILPYLHFQKQSALQSGSEEAGERGWKNLGYFLGVGMTSFSVWVVGTGLGYWAALSVPPGFEEGMRFILPGYFGCMLAAELRQRVILLICVASLVAAVPGALFNPDWGWLITALMIATIGWGLELWIKRGS